MRKLILLLVCMFLVGSNTVFAQNSVNQTQSNALDQVEAYYFHFTTRCVTCKTVEAEAKVDLETLYQGKVKFTVLNLDDPSSKPIAEKLGVTGQTLLLVKGKKQMNITSEGFLYATTKPAKLKSVIKQKVDVLMQP